MSFEKPPLTQTLSEPGAVPRAWAIWLTNLWVRQHRGAGPTVDRPTKDLQQGITQYYDTTLGKPIWLHSVRPTVWKDAAGVTV